MKYKIYYKMSGVDLEYKYATTVSLNLLNKAIIECFENDLVELLIIEHDIKNDMDNPIPYFFGTNQQYQLQEHSKIKRFIKHKRRGPRLKVS